MQAFRSVLRASPCLRPNFLPDARFIAKLSTTQTRSDTWVPSLSRCIPGHSSSVDPFRLVSSDLEVMANSIRSTVSILQHPVLDAAAAHLLSLHGKRIRPIIVLLIAHSAAPLVAAPGAIAAQRNLAEITELIHAASLLHDDVIDVASTRRGERSVNAVFGNQLAVLAGDFLLARASVALARLRDCDVVELLSTVIEHLVRGEVIQMGNGSSFKRDENDLFEAYMSKTFFKTASLVANSCRAVTMLAGHTKEVADAAYNYGKDVGIAFQLMDDLLDIIGTADKLGKPVLNDLRQGHATAPVLYALQQFPELLPMIERRFNEEGDIETTLELVKRADGLTKTRELATEHILRAVDTVVQTLPANDYRSALVNLANFALTRER
ncbi:Solanesyl-diphosphate synthase 1, mitochondrial [Gracilariopsis chorda]|uniref:Solanesyl-diphosphate synthase 1, mitochondrial n=1 Tax=Gracilariopsis chorda TaxID=448386 RepID=A0A2V3IG96_9FLOR|nr:Solanesyl-diphosphate synthase 1, mitochondrial [Gracilariopsis chorda]|eukprot:PXF41072.1 Solanesyl-diphosphate synthase 1, mitochondrial [Gracilariopsis chorda]